MKKISLEQLLIDSREEEYAKQYEYICRRIGDGQLIPVKKSPLNGKKPALHLSYWIAEEEPDYSEEIEELNFRLVPAIRTDYYLKHLKVYREEAEWVRLLNRYFLQQEQGETGRAGEPVYVSLNERSFQIWGREKFLQREQGRTILAHCGVGLEQLYVYGTTEPLAYYSASQKTPQNILILENKDTFYSMRRYLMGEGQRKNRPLRAEELYADSGEHKAVQGQTDSSGRIFGVEIGTLIYGAGKGILRSFEDFDFCLESHINAPENQILYFGDLDYEGIGIYERLANLFRSDDSRTETAETQMSGREPSEPGTAGTVDLQRKQAERRKPEIKPFVQAYERMLEKAEEQGGMDFLPRSSEKQNRNLSGLFSAYFSEPERERMRQVLTAGKYIPQEIVNIMDYGVSGGWEGKC